MCIRDSSEPDSEGKTDKSNAHPDPNIFRYSKHDSSPSPLEDDSPIPRDEPAEPNAPPDVDNPAEEPQPPLFPTPEVVAGPSPDSTPGTSQGGQDREYQLLLLQRAQALAIVRMSPQDLPEPELLPRNQVKPFPHYRD